MRTIIDEARDNLTDKELADIILFIRHSMFLPENNKIAELREMIMKAIYGEFSTLKDTTLDTKQEKCPRCNSEDIEKSFNFAEWLHCIKCDKFFRSTGTMGEGK